MELIALYLKNKYEYHFYIADKKKEIYDIRHIGITVEEYPAYMNCYKAIITMNNNDYSEINMHADGWRNRRPKVIRENPLGETESYDMHFEGYDHHSESRTVSIRCILKKERDNHLWN